MAEDPIKHTIEKNKHGQVQYLDNLITEHLSDYRKHHPNAGYNTFRARIEEANPGVDWSHLKLG
ncbi:hypothetical protein GO009_17210, partial [Muricauda sp. TY007]|uniref:hypothetical protein n=1 Tax=Allomuricauda sp. TY007 TaxID=2683200 RepID=UPI0013C1F6BD